MAPGSTQGIAFPPSPLQPGGRATAQSWGQEEGAKRTKKPGFYFFFLFQTAEVVWGFYTAIGVWERVGVMVSGCPQWKAAAPSITAQCHLPPLLFLSSPLLLSSPVPSPFPLGFCHISHLGKGSNRRRSLPPPLPRRSPPGTLGPTTLGAISPRIGSAQCPGAAWGGSEGHWGQERGLVPSWPHCPALGLSTPPGRSRWRFQCRNSYCGTYW